MTAKLKNIKALSRWLWNTWHGYRLQAVLNVIVGLLIVVSDLSLVWVTKLTIDAATGQGTTLGVKTGLGLMVVVIFLQMGLGIASRWIRAVLGVRAQNKMQRSLFIRLMECEWIGVRRFHTGDLLNRMIRDVGDVIRFLTESLPSLIIAIFQFLGAFLFLFWMDSNLAVIVVLILPVFLLMSRLYMRRMRSITHRARELEARVQSIVQESLQHFLLIKSLVRIGEMKQKLYGTQHELSQEIVRRTKYATISGAVMNMGFAAGYIFSFSWGVLNLQSGLITYGALIAFVQLVGQIQRPVRTLTHFIPVFITAFTATERLMQLDEIALEPELEPTPIPGPAGIRIKGLHYRYTDSGRKILENLDYTFPPGSVSAIVGETGAGKTTLIRLLLSVLKSSEGEIALFNASGHEVAVSPATRLSFAYVPQGNTLLSGTVRDNLLLGNPDATDEEMRTALHTAAADFVFQREDGLNTRCGEVGDGFSEGQAQRISIARALLTKAPIFLFDEATSALDEHTEQAVVERIISQKSDATLIFVTHRPEVLKYCTQTLQLQKINNLQA
ncbi:MAG: ABC transporter ATP-binding protein [Bacteroidaceae bacterium]|nr:ABC transporter ATP-binding protein [Bacteroidaceae bacterium]